MSLVFVTRGFATDKLAPLPPGTTGLALNGAASGVRSVTLTFNRTPAVIGDPGLWVITGRTPAPTVTGLTVNGSELTVATTDQRSGAAYTLVIPVGALQTPDGGPFLNDRYVPFTGVGASPTIVRALYENETHMRLQFSEPLEASSMGNAANYVVTPSLQVLSVEILSSTEVRLTTARQFAGVIYSLQARNLYDLAGTPLALSQT